MKYFLAITMFLMAGLYPTTPEDCSSCNRQDGEYNCAGNTLSMNYRLCMDISEVSGLMYKTFLEDLKLKHGADSEMYSSNLPDFEKWKALFPGITQKELSVRYFDTDDFALIPIMAISHEQAVSFCDWRTEQFKKELSKMSAADRAQFPKDFRFRLPTAKEWARIRFMKQEKGMIKTIQKITASTTKAYKVKKNALINDNPKLSHVYNQLDDKLAMYNLFNNVAEMTAEKGVAMGGSWQAGNEASKFDKEFSYGSPEAWLGFRCIFEIIN